MNERTNIKKRYSIIHLIASYLDKNLNPAFHIWLFLYAHPYLIPKLYLKPRIIHTIGF